MKPKENILPELKEAYSHNQDYVVKKDDIKDLIDYLEDVQDTVSLLDACKDDLDYHLGRIRDLHDYIFDKTITIYN